MLNMRRQSVLWKGAKDSCVEWGLDTAFVHHLISSHQRSYCKLLQTDCTDSVFSVTTMVHCLQCLLPFSVNTSASIRTSFLQMFLVFSVFHMLIISLSCKVSSMCKTHLSLVLHLRIQPTAPSWRPVSPQGERPLLCSTLFTALLSSSLTASFSPAQRILQLPISLEVFFHIFACSETEQRCAQPLHTSGSLIVSVPQGVPSLLAPASLTTLAVGLSS